MARKATKPKRPKAKAVPAGDRRARLVDAAVELYVENGVAETSLSSIAKRAGVDPQLLQYHFPSADALLAEVMQRVIADYVARTLEFMEKARPATPLDALRAYVLAYFDWARKNPGYGALFMHFIYLSGRKERFAAVNLSTRLAGRERIASMIYRCLEFGDLVKPAHSSVEELAHGVQLVMLGGLIGTYSEPASAPSEGAERTWRAILRLFDPQPVEGGAPR